MTILQNALSGLSGLTKAPNQGRLPVMPAGAMQSFGYAGAGGGMNKTQNLAAMGGTAWLFSVIDRIATSTASIDWHLYQVAPDGNRTELFNHPAKDLWNSVNPYYTNDDFIETFMQHFELCGEAWWVLLRNSFGVPVEIWPVRPDRMRPIPSRDEYIAGYIYQIGSERIPLERDDVIFIRRPSPTDPYRGMGVVQSILIDIESERMATQWNRNFFANSAEPGGIIELDEELDDESFERFASRWKQQHTGVANAHRVAIIERGKWVDRKFTQRDMQFEQLRRLNRDTILGAFGLHKHILGASDDVNRANAEAAHLQFAQWILVPRLRRIRAALNERLLPIFGNLGMNLAFDFDDPVPSNRELHLEEAIRGYEGGILTRNEARHRLGESETPDGDEFVQPQTAPPFALSVSPTARNNALSPSQNQSGSTYINDAYIHTDKETDPTELLPDPVSKEERSMERAWTRRLRAEAILIGEYFEQFFKSYYGVAITKLEPSDAGGLPLNWPEKYGADVATEIEHAWLASAYNEFPGFDPSGAVDRARTWAREHSGELLKNAELATRKRVGELVATTIEEGQSLTQLQKTLREDHMFSRVRAETIARTETATAHGFGARDAAGVQGKNQKHWFSQGASEVAGNCILGDEGYVCLVNESRKWIGINEDFQNDSKYNSVPAHINCRCTIRYRTKELHETTIETPVETKCPKCNRMLGKYLNEGAEIKCARCSELVTVTSQNVTKNTVTQEA